MDSAQSIGSVQKEERKESNPFKDQNLFDMDMEGVEMSN